MKTHPLTRAGKIDALANAQARLAGDLASGNTNSTVKLASEDAKPGEEISGTPGERQGGIKQRIGSFLDDPGFEPEALKHLQSSDDLAGKSQERIAHQDFNAASEPAAEAARELRHTAAAVRAGGNQAAKNKLADALLQLSAAAGNVRKAASAKSDAEAAAELKKSEDAVREAAKQLAAEAQRQQENGSTNAAARLDEMAKQLQSESLKQMLAQTQQSPRDAAQSEVLAKKLDDLAERAGQQRNPGQPTRQELARLVERLQRTQVNLKNLVSQCSSPGAAGASGGNPAAFNEQVSRTHGPEMSRVEMQQAEAVQLLDDLRLGAMDSRSVAAKTIHLAKLDELLREASKNSGANPHDFVPLAAELDPPLAGLINSLQTELAGMRRQYQLASRETASAPPAYRPAVTEYFEQVSRDYQPAKNDAEKNK